MESTDERVKYFYEIYDAMPRQGPGDRASTERALALLPPVTNDYRLLDIGCGSGTQTLDLARATPARIVAVDNHQPFLDRLRTRLTELGLRRRVKAQLADMNDLPFADGSFDVVWSEGAIFVVGFARGLAEWRRLLVPGGYLVVSDLCWLTAHPAAELRELFAPPGSDVGDLESRRTIVAAAGYHLLGEFILPAVGWWENYYVPLTELLARFRVEHAGNAAALAVAAESEREIELYRKYGGDFGYGFFAMRRDERALRAA